MEEEILSDSSNESVKPKKKVDRSAAYASSDIPTSLNLINEFYKNFRSTLTKRDDIFNIIPGLRNSDISTACYYQFLNREKDSYQVTEFYKAISDPLDDAEYRKFCIEAFQKPTLNRELIAKYNGDTLPVPLEPHLIRFFRITKEAAPRAAEVFIKSAKYCGVLDSNNVLNINGHSVEDQANTSDETITDATVIDTKINNSYQNPPPKDNGNDGKNDYQPLLPEMGNAEKVKVRITGGRFLYLVYPDDINSKDVSILQLEIDKLKLLTS